jgi:chromosome segregation ATPase
MRQIRRFVIVSVLLLVAGCATSSDPAQGGFISGVNGILTGSYDQRVNARSGELYRLKTQQVAAQDEARRAQSDVAGRERQVRELRDKVNRLDRSLKAAQAAAARQQSQNVSLSVKDRQLAAELESDRARLATLQAQLQSGAAGADYEAEQQQYLSLQAAIEALGEQLRGAQSQ